MYINKKSRDYFFVTIKQKTHFNCVTIKFTTPEQEWRETLKLLKWYLFCQNNI